MKNYINKSINILTLCDKVKIDVLTFQKITEQVRQIFSQQIQKAIMEILRLRNEYPDGFKKTWNKIRT
jgi:hypothetical protein